MLIQSIFIVLCLSSYAKSEVPSFLKVCQGKESDLSGCIVKSMNMLLPLLPNGIPELGLPALEPMKLDDIITNTMNVTSLKLTNVVPFEIVDFSGSYEKFQFALLVKFTNIGIIGDYTLQTKLLSIPLQGHGPLNATIGSSLLRAKLKGKRVTINDKPYVQFRFLEFKLGEYKNIRVNRIDGLFPENKQLAEAAETVVRDNADVLLDEISGEVDKNLQKATTNVINLMTTKFTEDEIFPK